MRLITGEYGARVLEPLLPDARGRDAAARRCRWSSVPNRFFGGNIAVTGLLTGGDVAARSLEHRAASEQARYLLPDVVLSNGRFLDGDRRGRPPGSGGGRRHRRGRARARAVAGAAT